MQICRLKAGGLRIPKGDSKALIAIHTGSNTFTRRIHRVSKHDAREQTVPCGESATSMVWSYFFAPGAQIKPGASLAMCVYGESSDAGRNRAGVA